MIVHRETLIAKLSEIQQNVDFLISQLQASEHDKLRPISTDPAGNSGQPATLLLPRIVRWVHVIDIHGAYTLNLDDGFFASPAEVIGLGWHDFEAAGG
jgi:hypothetical protein